MEEDDIVRIVKEILTVDVDDGILFEYESIEPIREEDAYNNFRVHLRAKYGKIDTPMKIDVTTGDAITPAAVQYDFPMLFEDKTVPAMAYTLETVLAEKYETIIRRHCLYRGGQFRRQLPAKTVFCGLLRNPWLWYSCLLRLGKRKTEAILPLLYSFALHKPITVASTTNNSFSLSVSSSASSCLRAVLFSAFLFGNMY